jgi:hypothetical protein
MYYKQSVFIADWCRSIYNEVMMIFRFVRPKIILYWFHLEKKFSMAFEGKEIRNEYLERSLLWRGNMDRAIGPMVNGDPEKIKQKEHLKKLTDYLNRALKCFLCHALPKEIGLHNSSGLGKKSNDCAMARRQKDNEMSQGMEGSVSLAYIY